MERARTGRGVGWDVWLCALGVVVLGWAVFAHGAGRPDTLRQLAESRINQSLADAGYGWANVKVEGSTGVLSGTAPDPISRTALVDLAHEVVEPYAGLPGVFWALEDHTRLNEQLPPRPPKPAPEPEVDLLADLPAPGAGKSRGKGPTLAACSKAFQTVQETRPVRFRPGSARLDRANSQSLQQLAALALRCSNWRVIVEAPLDSTGARRGDVALGERRAAAIAAALMVDGVPAGQIEALAQAPEAIETALAEAAASSSAPAASTASVAVRPEARLASRNRVEFRLAALTPR
ncbi:OmpA family protein [Sphaerotilus mobilis]|uniref:Outer membrane protein OmpA-like peptidoglycan-associated protein n=1 Tax=Sphaerotilus mobilis TaxID=47994 RepID=A0A4Q7LUI7_9BURK|nr:OmpA family protein [Sphaerotilus mobilis]RZS58033.1 outer membrane protein OmpA-like peptidoglycan-associated protein [Sphaerotilus mobilis]